MSRDRHSLDKRGLDRVILDRILAALEVGRRPVVGDLVEMTGLLFILSLSRQSRFDWLPSARLPIGLGGDDILRR